jgi:hypothetical protein
VRDRYRFPTWRTRWTWPAELLLEDREEAFAALRRAESSGRPVGAAEFVTGLERLLGRPVRAALPGRDLQPESPPSDWIWCDRYAVDLCPLVYGLGAIQSSRLSGSAGVTSEAAVIARCANRCGRSDTRRKALRGCVRRLQRRRLFNCDKLLGGLEAGHRG